MPLAVQHTQAAVPFRFDADVHVYTALDTGEILPGVTGMLARYGLTSEEWYTTEGRVRGAAIHAAAQDYDMGALTLDDLPDWPYRAYLAAHIAAMQQERPEILAVEEPVVHPVRRYGCRPDRVWRLRGSKRLAVVDLKTGAKNKKADPVQTALQAMALEHRYGLRADLWWRGCLYLKPSGRFVLDPHEDPADFGRAALVLAACGV